MGLFEKVKAAKQRVEEKSFASNLEKEFLKTWEQEEIERQAAMPERHLAMLDSGLIDFPFSPKSYISMIEQANDKDAYLRDSPVYFADAEALAAVGNIVAELKRRVIEVAGDSEYCRPIDFSIVEPIVDELQPIPENYCVASLNEMTATGRKPKYRAFIRFNAYTKAPRRKSLEEMSAFVSTGARGKISYLQNGRVGAADFHTWDGNRFVSIWFKEFAGELRVSQIREDRDEYKRVKTVYKAE